MIHVTFLWHMHQPMYRDLVSLDGTLPWVRLHGVGEYYGMARILEERPPVHAMVNWVPCLLDQLEETAAGTYEDRALRVARKPADGLEAEEVVFMLRSFFRANRERMIRPHRRFAELLDKRGDDPSRLEAKTAEFSEQDLRDLQVWANLAWFHVTLQQDDPVIAPLLAKGGRFTEDDKEALLKRQLEILGEVTGMYRALADAGQIELTTSPYYHPILPLLADMTSARMARPQVPLPAMRGPYAEDAVAQLERARVRHERSFGHPPAGLWPSEGAVSAGIVPLVAGAGFSWMGTDEGILGRSLGLDRTRDWAEELVMPHLLHTPYRFEAEGKEMTLVFRDRVLSDRMGFKYQHMGAREAVADFVGRLQNIPPAGTDKDFLVAVILDGENPWESYPRGGYDFLGLLYNRLTELKGIRTTTVSSYLETHEDLPRLERLHAGSWIDADFSVWIGSREDNLAWDALGKARAFHEAKRVTGGKRAAEAARESLFAAEGSDWFWWYGDRFSSEEDEDFDSLFRTHLGNVYRAWGEPPPGALLQPIARARRRTFTRPVSFLDITLDGEKTHYFEWHGAGTYDPRRDYASMGPARESAVSAVAFGFDPAHLYLRIDPIPSATAFLASGKDVRIHLNTGRWISLRRRPGAESRGALAVEGEEAERHPRDPGAWAAGKILEISIPFAMLTLEPGALLRIQIEAVRRGRVIDRFPRGGAFDVVIPGSDFELETWFV